MEPKIFLTVFSTVLLAEMGDKTQLATLLFAADEKHEKWTVFLAAALALCLAAAIGVLAGAVVGRYVSPKLLTWIAGVGFIAIGVWTIAKA